MPWDGNGRMQEKRTDKNAEYKKGKMGKLACDKKNSWGMGQVSEK